MMVHLTIKEMSYLVVGLFGDLVGPFSYLYRVFQKSRPIFNIKKRA